MMTNTMTSPPLGNLKKEIVMTLGLPRGDPLSFSVSLPHYIDVFTSVLKKGNSISVELKHPIDAWK